MQLYSFDRFYQILILMLAIILLVTVTTWLSVFSKKGVRLVSFWAMSLILLCWMMLKAAEIVAPNLQLQIAYRHATMVVLGLAGLVWIYFVFTCLFVWQKGQLQMILRTAVSVAGLFPSFIPIIVLCSGQQSILGDTSAFYTPIVFYGILILLALRSRRTGFIDMLPVALSQILNNFEESALLIDKTGKIVECSHLPEGVPNTIQSLDALLTSFSAQNACIEELEALRKAVDAPNENGNGLLTFVNGNRAFTWLIRHVRNPLGRKIGTILIFCDITEQNKLLCELKQQQAQQQTINRKLLSYHEVVENLTSERERASILLHFQNSLGYSMSALQGMLSDCLSEKMDAATLVNKIDNSAKFARVMLEELRQSVRTYGAKRSEEEI